MLIQQVKHVVETSTGPMAVFVVSPLIPGESPLRGFTSTLSASTVVLTIAN